MALEFVGPSKKYLYHGTTRKRWDEISKEGLRPFAVPDFGGIVAVFFSESPGDAYGFGVVKAYQDQDPRIVLLRLDVKCARRHFILLRKALGQTLPRGSWWLSNQRVPPECFTVIEERVDDLVKRLLARGPPPPMES